MKKLGTAIRLIALAVVVPAALMAGPQPVETEAISSGCAQFCRDVCILNGEPCCFVSSTTCGCC
ncbi:MAG TPA: hypothetical protein VLT87_23320 [Thermoanaerobaculia bacterium]|nr:hypothetical protein [Thermoanaerobaculia bacterium]